jgi:hypothetical protein
MFIDARILLSLAVSIPVLLVGAFGYAYTRGKMDAEFNNKVAN